MDTLLLPTLIFLFLLTVKSRDFEILHTHDCIGYVNYMGKYVHEILNPPWFSDLKLSSI